MEFIEACSCYRSDPVTLEQVREALSTIPNSLSDDINRERDER
jgi:hypothetical protein